jgi:hypothetical protein
VIPPQTGVGLWAQGSRPAIVATICLLCGVNFLGCGRKGPPLPPIVYAPSAVGEFTARRVGGDIVLQFKVPTTNTNAIGPADLDRLEVYGHTGSLPAPVDYLKYGTLIGTLAVKAPPDAVQQSASGQRAEGGGQTEGQKAEGGGQMVEQGAATTVRELMTPALLEPGALPYTRQAAPVTPPLEVVETPGTVNLPPPIMRYYVVMGTSRKNKKGAFAGPLGVPVSTDLPAAPDTPVVNYTQDSLAVTWTPAQGAPPRFNVYEVTDPGDVGPTVRVGVPPVLAANTVVLTEPTFTDKIQFGTKKCFVVRSVSMVGAVAIESEPSAPACVTPLDTFSPAAPKELAAVSDDKGVNLIWEANTDADLGGYLVMRLLAGSAASVSLTSEPIKETSYRDTTAEVGRTYTYSVVAVDTATPANKSAESNRVEVIR